MNCIAGRHLTVDLQLRDSKYLRDEAVMRNLLERMGDTLDMTIVAPPAMFKFPWMASELERFTSILESSQDYLVETAYAWPHIKRMREHLEARKKDQSGITGFSVWLESHCSIHTFPERGEAHIDIFSCKDFASVRALILIREIFGDSILQGGIAEIERQRGGYMPKVNAYALT